MHVGSAADALAPLGAASVRLVRPDWDHLPGYLKMVDEYDRFGQTPHGPRAREPRRDFEAYLSWLRCRCRAAQAGPGVPAMSVYWLADRRGRVLGSARLRHWLTERTYRVAGHVGYDIRPSMRRKGLGRLQLDLVCREARRRGMVRLLLTTDEANLPSRKLIEACGGLQDRSLIRKGRRHLRYWIWLA
jgi:predicted acetyltransferase